MRPSRFAVAVLLFGTLAFGQSGYFVSPKSETDAAINLYLAASGGSDTNECVSASAPCATISGALGKLPKGLRHLATVNVAAGTYATGIYVSGFTCYGSGTSAGVKIQGALATFSPATGSATGTATSATTGVSGAAWGTLTKTAAGWTVNNLRGKILTINDGSAAGDYLIASNTATVITIAGAFSAAPGTPTYTIKEQAAIFTGTVAFPTSVSGLASGSAGVIVSNNSCSEPDQISFFDIKISGSPSVYAAGTGSVYFDRVWFVNGERGTNFQGQMLTRRSYLAKSTGAFTSQVILTGVASTLQGSTSAVYTFRESVADGAFTVATGNFVSNDLSVWDTTATSTTSISLGWGTHVVGAKIDCQTKAGSKGISNLDTVRSAAQIYLSSSDISNCVTGIELTGPAWMTTTTNASAPVIGTGNTTALNISKGAQVLWYSGNTLTGTTDINVDGTTSDLATFRAIGPPKVMNSSTFFTLLRED